MNKFFLVFFVFFSCFAATYHVAPGATGANNGTSLADAWITVDSVSNAKWTSGDTLFCHKTGVDTIKAAGGRLEFPYPTPFPPAVALSCSSTTNDYSPGYKIYGASGITSLVECQNYAQLRGFWLEKGGTSTDIVGGFSASSIWITECVFYGGRDQINSGVDDHNLISNNTFLYPGRYAWNANNSNKYYNNYVYGGAYGGVVEIGCAVVNNVFDSIYTGYALLTNGGDHLIYGNTFFRCVTGIQQTAAWAGIFANVFDSCGTGIYNVSGKTGTEDYNVFYACGTNINNAGFLHSGGNSGTASSRPLLDPINKNYTRVRGTLNTNTPAVIGAYWYTGTKDSLYINAGTGLPDTVCTGGSGGSGTPWFWPSRWGSK